MSKIRYESEDGKIQLIDIPQRLINKLNKDSYNQALEDLLEEICIGCDYLKGLECTNKRGCPCVISQKEVVREIIKLKK